MDEQEPNPFDSAKFKQDLLDKIKSIAPANQEQAEEFKKSNKVASVKSAVKTEVSQEKDSAQGPIKQTAEQPPDTSSAKPKEVTLLPSPDYGPKPPDLGAQEAAPKPKSEEEVSLAEESHSLDEQMQKSSVTKEQLSKSNEPSFQGALDAKSEAQTNAIKAPLSYRQEESKIISSAKNQAMVTAQTSIHGMHDTRKNQFDKIGENQQTTKSDDERHLSEFAAKLEWIYNDTQAKVKTRLDRIDTEVNQIFDSGAEQAKQEFENHVDSQMSAYKFNRYISLGPAGLLLWAKDKLLGLPEEVNKFYEEGRTLFIKKMDNVIDNVAKVTEKGLLEAKALISQGRVQVQQEFGALPENLQKSGQDAVNKIQSKFDTLRKSVDDKRDQLIDSLAKKYADNLQKVDDRINQMKEENKGLVDKAKDALEGIINTIIELKNMLLGVFSRAAAAIDKIIKDPIGFLRNLVNGIKQGLEKFIANIGAHLQKGLVDWLFGTLSKAGITMPKSFDFKGILDLVLQVLGLTYPNIRKRAVGILGEKTVKTLETAAEIFKILITQGPAGIWEYIKEKIGDLKETVIEGIKSFLMEKVIMAGITWIIGLLNPASAFVKAAKAIYDIVMFFVNKGSQIISLVNAIIDSVSAIADGAIGVAATAVENALAKAVPVVIGFLASLLGLGGIDEKIKKDNRKDSRANKQSN